MGSVDEGGSVTRATRVAVWVGMALGAAGGFFSGYVVGHSDGRLAESRENREITLRQRENDAKLLGVSATRLVGPTPKGDARSAP